MAKVARTSKEDSLTVDSCPSLNVSNEATADLHPPRTIRSFTHKGQGRTHLWLHSVYSVCKLWKCGTPIAPAPTADFEDVDVKLPNKNQPNICKICFGTPWIQSTISAASAKTIESRPVSECSDSGSCAGRQAIGVSDSSSGCSSDPDA